MDNPDIGPQVLLFSLAAGVLLIGFVTNWVITRRMRRLLRASLRRDVRDGEETSLEAWMEVPDDRLTQGLQEMRADPVLLVASPFEGMTPDGEQRARAEPSRRSCPRDSTPLSVQMIGAAHCYECPTCSGLWVHGPELSAFLSSAPAHMPSLLVPAAPDAAPATNERRDAPRCLCDGATQMCPEKRLGVRIDVCPKCGAVWLDGGELFALMNSGEPPEPELGPLLSILRGVGVGARLFSGGRSGGGGGGASW